MTLSDNIHQLTNPHMAQQADGSYGLNPALLDQLNTACTSTLGANGSGSGGAGLLVNSKAIKLNNDINAKALFEHFEYAGEEYRGPLKNLLRTWPTATNNAIITRLEGITDNWVAEIQTLTTPRRPPWKPTLNCPSCGQRYHGPEREQCLTVEYWDHDKEAIAHPSQWTAACDGCGAQWAGDQLNWLRDATHLHDTVAN